jgi:hypothetical protein
MYSGAETVFEGVDIPHEYVPLNNVPYDEAVSPHDRNMIQTIVVLCMRASEKGRKEFQASKLAEMATTEDDKVFFQVKPYPNDKHYILTVVFGVNVRPPCSILSEIKSLFPNRLDQHKSNFGNYGNSSRASIEFCVLMYPHSRTTRVEIMIMEGNPVTWVESPSIANDGVGVRRQRQDGLPGISSPTTKRARPHEFDSPLKQPPRKVPALEKDKQ